MIISLIVAIGENREIGCHNKLLWNIPEDLKQFKQRTLGHSILMGRKTFESIGRPLPKRENLILTRNPRYEAPGAKVFSHLEEAFSYAKQGKVKELFVIGGEQIYREALAYADHIYLTKVEKSYEADAFFPAFSHLFTPIGEKKSHEANNDTPAWSFQVYKKIS